MARMAMRLRCFYLCALLLIVFANLSQERFIPSGQEVLQRAEETMKTVGDKINSTVRAGVNSIFEPLRFHTTSTTEVPRSSEEPSEEPSEEEFEIGFRQIISAPARCPPNHNYVRGRCRQSI